MGLRSELAGCLFTCPTGDLHGHKHITLSLWVTFRLCKMEAMILGRNSVRTAILCAECHVWLSTVMWQIYTYYYLNFFQDIPKYQRTIANIFKDFSIDLQSVELLGVTHTHVLELLVEKQNQTFQDVLIFLSKEFLRGRNEISMGFSISGSSSYQPRAGSGQSQAANRGAWGGLIAWLSKACLSLFSSFTPLHPVFKDSLHPQVLLFPLVLSAKTLIRFGYFSGTLLLPLFP